MRTFPVVFTGHVDHGKSTLVARLLLDTGKFPDGRLAELQAAAQRRDVPLEISFLLDAFQVERDQAITIDATRVWFEGPTRRYAIIDAPGHREFVRHMVSGASDALAAVVVVDAAEGIGEQTRRHALLLPLVGVTRAIVAINKMDTVDASQARYDTLGADLRALFARTGLTLAAAIPTIARDGDNVVTRSAAMPWYDGPSLLDALEALQPAATIGEPLRFAVQDVYRRNEERILVGNVAGMPIAAGTELAFAPTRDRARVTRIVRFPDDGAPARPGEAVGIALDTPLYVGPGDVCALPDALPHIGESIAATVFWLDRTSLRVGEHLRLRCAARDVTVVLEAIGGVMDVSTFTERPTATLERNDIAQVTLRALQPLVVDVHPGALARFALYRGDAAGGGGIVRSVVVERDARRTSSPGVVSSAPGVSAAERAQRLGHRGLVIWMTGLPSAGKSTLAAALETALFAEGAFVYVLDGDNLRTGLNGDLGFSLDDRRENVRRTGEVAALFADAGCITIVALVSPLREDRERARGAARGAFREIYVKADVAVCETRDPKGMYRRAREGTIADFTGISSPYEAPLDPEFTVDTARNDVAACVAELLPYLRSESRL